MIFRSGVILVPRPNKKDANLDRTLITTLTDRRVTVTTLSDRRMVMVVTLHNNYPI